MVKLSGKTDPCQAANTLPAIPARTADAANASSLYPNTGTPMLPAATSSSRIASQARPIRERRRRASAARTTSARPQIR